MFATLDYRKGLIMHHAEKNKNVIYRLGRSVLERICYVSFYIINSKDSGQFRHIPEEFGNTPACIFREFPHIPAFQVFITPGQ